MHRFEHIRHRPPSPLVKTREIILVISPLRSSVNLSRMVRLAGCSGIQRIVHCGTSKVDRNIARQAIEYVQLETRRSLVPLLSKLRTQGFCLVGLEQTTNSQLLTEFEFQRKTALIIGSEREGLSQEALDQLDAVVEIPVFGQPASYNVVTATTMAVYEYCRQFPEG
ncbi:MAG: TrmH family RNA methyltransferase [Planctomycetota bacterium]